LPINTIKIDRAFIQDIPENRDSIAITEAILSMSHSLGLNVVAEGVESDQQVIFLRSRNCDLMQGFLFSQPVSQNIFTTMLIEKKRLSIPET
jgi:EAL domain-containing protein (putative c-di-GMP-specific phosphodiesterase class I)